MDANVTKPPEIQFIPANWESISSFAGSLAVFVPENGSVNKLARKLDNICGGQISKYLASPEFVELKAPGIEVIGYPGGCTARSLLVAKVPVDATPEQMKRLGTGIAMKAVKSGVCVLAGDLDTISDIALGVSLGSYSFDRYRTAKPDQKNRENSLLVVTGDPKIASDGYHSAAAVAKGVNFTRDLVNEPANILTTSEFAKRVSEFRELGLSVSVLEEAELERIGMRTLLSVGAGSATPSKVAMIEWKGASGPPLALVGKGVVFDTGGISIKPALRMEEMTMDMAGAAVVAGVMKTLAMRKSPSHVVGALGLVENMPGGRALRPGDVVKSLKGDTVEVINTDAEGRLVLADLLWYVQDTHKPSAMIDLATLTGAIIVGIGNELAGVFSNDDELVDAFLCAAEREGEGAWRMPLHDPYDKLLKSRVADIKNVGDRSAGAVTAAQFLKRFVKADLPWIHMDIAGVAYSEGKSGTVPKGATGWGVQSIDRLIKERFEVT